MGMVIGLDRLWQSRPRLNPVPGGAGGLGTQLACSVAMAANDPRMSSTREAYGRQVALASGIGKWKWQIGIWRIGRWQKESFAVALTFCFFFFFSLPTFRGIIGAPALNFSCRARADQGRARGEYTHGTRRTEVSIFMALYRKIPLFLCLFPLWSNAKKWQLVIGAVAWGFLVFRCQLRPVLISMRKAGKGREGKGREGKGDGKVTIKKEKMTSYQKSSCAFRISRDSPAGSCFFGSRRDLDSAEAP